MQSCTTTSSVALQTEVRTPTSLPRSPRRSPDAVEVWIDFDGTITQRDVLDELIKRFAVDDSWQEVERLWSTGKIGSYECLRREFDLIRIGEERLKSFLATIPLDEGVGQLFGLLRSNNVPFAILSDGIELFIRTILAGHAPADLVIRSNGITFDQDRLTLVCPHRKDACESRAAHCKCSSANELHSPGRSSIYIGDGRSDLCPARKADVVFAKGALARPLTAEGKAFIPFDTLADVARVLQESWAVSATGASAK